MSRSAPRALSGRADSDIHFVLQVGPYALHGKLLVKVCAAEGVHYVDLTGEPSFVGSMVKQHSAAAHSTRAILVPSCGFDSVPSDLCAYLAVQALKRSGAEGDKPVEVGETVGLMKAVGSASGGTLATLSKHRACPFYKSATTRR